MKILDHLCNFLRAWTAPPLCKKCGGLLGSNVACDQCEDDAIYLQYRP